MLIGVDCAIMRLSDDIVTPPTEIVSNSLHGWLAGRLADRTGLMHCA